MCGICGIINTNGNRSRMKALIGAMCDVSFSEPLEIELLKRFRSGKRGKFFIEIADKEEKTKIIKSKSLYKKWIAEADEILNGNLTLLGRQVNIDEQVDWNKDPIDNTQWPKTFYANVHKDAKTKSSDIKYIWELNCHQYLILCNHAKIPRAVHGDEWHPYQGVIRGQEVPLSLLCEDAPPCRRGASLKVRPLKLG